MTALDASQPPTVTRRSILKAAASGFGYLAFAGMAHATATRETHFPARAKRVILLCMNGGPSHVDTFDPKPELKKRSGGASPQGGAMLLGSPFQFRQHGGSGLWVSEVFPELAKRADDLCVVRSMHTDLPNHSQAFLQMHTGSFQFVRPSLGAWALYGLGTANANLPGFVSVNPPSDNGGTRNYGSAFLPAACQGTRLGTNQIPGFYAKLLGKDEEPGPPLRNVGNPDVPRELQRVQLDLARGLNRHKLAADVHQPEVEGAIEAFELAFRMQDELPKVLDTRAEPRAVLDRYGVGSGLPTDRFGRQCILARRLVEAGVRFVEVTAPVGWDHHFFLKDELTKSAVATDRPVAALLADLKERGLLADTLVIWAGEFGRTPYVQSGTGRDHNSKGYTLWMAGGGVKGGFAFGATDELGYAAVEKPVHVHDWHATILHLLGLDHTQLTFNYGGRDYRLTDVHGEVVKDILT